MYFDAVVVEVKTFLLLFRLALAILCEFITANNIFFDLRRHSDPIAGPPSKATSFEHLQ